MESQKSSTKPTKAPASSERSERVSNDDLLAWMKNVQKELVMIRQLNSEMTRFMRDAESEIPESMRRFANYMHDVHDIKYMYEEHGIDVPQWIMREIERLDDRYRQLLKEHKAEGGTFNKVLREMAGDKENRWDHTKQLPKPQENGDASGQSE